MKLFIVFALAFFMFAQSAEAQLPSGANTIQAYQSWNSCGCGRRARQVQRNGNFNLIQVGLLNIMQTQGRSRDGASQQAEISKGKRTRFRLLGRRR